MKKPFLLLCLLAIVLYACSPKIQLGGMRAPANMIIDGLTTEWPGGKFAAYSPELRLYYTICNDDDYLYLIVKGKEYRSSNENLYGGGLKFEITSNSASVNKIAITYPQLPEQHIASVRKVILKFDQERYRIDSTSRMSRKQLDSILAVADKKISGDENRVKVTGIKGETDSIFTVANNPYNIKAAARFDPDSRLICEVAIPLWQLAQMGSSFSYSLKLYGIKWQGGAQESPILIQSKPLRNPPSATSDMIWSSSAHAVQGSYMLVK